MASRVLVGAEAALGALESGERIGVALVSENASEPAERRLLTRLEAAGASVYRESEREMRRMTPGGCAPASVLAWTGPGPGETLAESMTRSGLVFGLIGLRYPGNVGFILRSVEVAGGAAVAIDSEWDEGQLEEAHRVSMRAGRFMGVHRARAGTIVAAARAAGRSVIAVETSGRAAPWDADFARPALVLVGSETEGLPEAVLSDADAVVRIPSGGFIPSYNVQAAVGICLGEWLRQSAAADGPAGAAERRVASDDLVPPAFGDATGSSRKG